MRSIRPQTVTLAVLAILFGLGAALTFKIMLQPKPVEAPPAIVEPMEMVLIVQANLPPNARIRAADVASMSQPVAKVKLKNPPPDYFRYAQQAVGRIVKKEAGLHAGDMVSEKDFYPLGEVPAFKLREGFRAVTLRVDEGALASIIRTGCLVDVALTVDSPEESGIMLTRRLVHAVRVVSPAVSEGDTQNVISSVGSKSYVVVEATPEQAARLILAQQAGGSISVSLCGVTSEKPEPPPTEPLLDNTSNKIDMRELLGLQPPPPAPSPPEFKVVEQYAGTKLKFVIFDDNGVNIETDRAREGALPPAAAPGGKPTPAGGKKPCKDCEKKAKEAERQKRLQNSTPGPTLAPTPGPST